MLKYILAAFLILVLCVLNKVKNKSYFFILKTIVIVCFLEVTIFNINSYRTDFGNLKYIEFLNDEIKPNILQDGSQYVSLENLNTKVKSIYLKLKNVEKNQIIDYDIYYSDRSTSNRYLASKNYCEYVEKTKYSVISLSGNCKSISINIKNKDVVIEEISFNKEVPFEFNFPRAVGIVLLVLIIYSLKINAFWTEKYSVKNLKQNLALMFIIDFGILAVFFINNSCSNSEKDMYSNNFVKALSQGQISLSDTPSTEKLEELSNPYDAVERGNLKRTEDYIWDAAYFNHKYYVYFGALPAVVLMLPYYLITKKIMTSSVATLIFSILSIPVLVGITKKIFQKFFRELPFKYMAFSSLIMVFGTMLIWINVAPRFYELVTVAGFFFAIFGIYLLIDSDNVEGQVQYKKIFFGALSLALSVACRPTELFASLLALPIFVKIIVNVKSLYNRR